MDFPLTFPTSLKPKAAAAVLKAQRQFPALQQAKERITAGVFAFAEVACVATESREWRADLALDGVEEFLHILCVCDAGNIGFSDSGGFDRFASPIKRGIRASKEWVALMERLATGARKAPVTAPVVGEGDRPSEARPREPAAPLLRYRSTLKRAILVELTRKPDASDLQICRALDEDGAAELPQTWKKNAEDRLFEEAYMDSCRRHRIEIAISKVRADVRRL